MEVLDNVPIRLNSEEVLKRLQLHEKNEYLEKTVQELVEVVLPVVRPKAVYEVSYVDSKTDDSLDIGGVRFTSRILRLNLDKIERVFPFVATCGRELDEVTFPSNELMKNYCLDQIKWTVLCSACSYLEDYIRTKYALGQLSHMEPGALESWPITQQKELLSIFGNVEDLIGVKLTEEFLMIPVKSMSGIFFSTEIRFESCQLCLRRGCIGRRAPYDPDVAKKYCEKK